MSGDTLAPFWAELDLAGLQRAMRSVRADYPAALARGARARREVAARWTWKHSAERALNLLRDAG